MTAFKRILVALDLSTMDDELIRYSSFISKQLDIEKIYFLHIIPDFTMPKNVSVEFHKLFNPEYPVDEKVRDKLAENIQACFGETPGVDIQVEVIEGNPYKKLMHWLEVKNIDLLIVGHKNESEGSGITAKRVARKSKASVIFVPENATKKVQNILVPMDFSEYSARALQTALKFKNPLNEISVKAFYAVGMPPPNYYLEDLQNEGFRRLLMDAAEEHYENFLKKYDLPASKIQPTFIEDDLNSPAKWIEDFAKNNPTDLIVMGAKGHSAWEHFIYGSVTETLVGKFREKPVWVVH